MEQLKWEKLLCTKRIRESRRIKDKSIVRNEFEADYDRIVGSSSVRRLQDKAQVFPLQKNDVVRTRLTHSLEVSAMARSLGNTIGRNLENNTSINFDRKKTEELSALLQTAGLIHDLGNPPFGHYGETVIREWAKEKLDSNKEKHLKIEDLKSRQERLDFEYFDGNVQNLRIVTKLQTMNDVYGANFTFGTLATIIKYPYSSCHTTHPKHKFGFFKSEADVVEQIWKETGLKEGVRHPATYLLEAADDIIYICDDIEDGVKKGYINWNIVYEEIKEHYKESTEYKELFFRIDSVTPDREMAESECILAKVRMFRNNVQTYFFHRVVEEFLKNYDSIMCGCYKGELLQCEKEFVDRLKGITGKYCFSCNEVSTLELVGYRVIRELLDIFSNILLGAAEKDILDTGTYAGKVYNLISENYKFISRYDYNNKKYRTFDEMETYDKLQLIIDFISGMTDSYAVNLYKQLTGISLPE